MTKIGSSISRKAGGRVIVVSLTPKKVGLMFPNGKRIEVTWEHFKKHYEV